MGEFDFVAKDFNELYTLLNSLTIPLFGVYSIYVKTESAEDIKHFIRESDAYAHFNIEIVTTDNVLDLVEKALPSSNVVENVSPFTVLVDLLAKRQILLSRNLLSNLYSSIGHSDEELLDAVDTIYREFGSQTLIDETMLSSLFVINKVTYPRSALIEYINMTRYRKTKLVNCLNDMGNTITLHSMIKNVKALHKSKSQYLTTGLVESKQVRRLNTRNLNLMYQTLVTDRAGIEDVLLLMNIYERGLMVDVSVHEE